MSSRQLPTSDQRTPGDELIEFTRPNRPKTQVCELWLRGECKNRQERCAFLHENRSIAIRPKNAKTQTCERWLKGECTRQQSCWFLHEIRTRPTSSSSLKTETCQKWMKGKCAYKDGECSYRHDSRKEEGREEEKKPKKTGDKSYKNRRRDERDSYEIASE
ncbi:unnamed protein product, partial [Mesorhabditis belari]|uniref:C3H1-type domain-containing protein n=1 Tax=Mesorhabditis belari TaxID=2138241 RepID=A0AAF3EJR9_9BILA